MNHTRHGSIPITARVPHTWPGAAMARGRHDAGVGTRSNKVRLRRRPVRSSSRFVCEAILEAPCRFVWNATGSFRGRRHERADRQVF
jgi:hypothetical protein